MIGRRGFIGGLLALAAAPFAPKVAAPVEPGGPWLKANVWGVRPPLTEAQFLRAYDHSFGLRGIVDDGTLVTTIHGTFGPGVYHNGVRVARVQKAKGSLS